MIIPGRPDDHPREVPINREAKVRFEDELNHFLARENPPLAPLEFESYWCWEEISQLYCRVNADREVVEQLQTQLDMWRREAQAAQVALKQLRALIKEPRS